MKEWKNIFFPEAFPKSFFVTSALAPTLALYYIGKIFLKPSLIHPCYFCSRSHSRSWCQLGVRKSVRSYCTWYLSVNTYIFTLTATSRDFEWFLLAVWKPIKTIKNWLTTDRHTHKATYGGSTLPKNEVNHNEANEKSFETVISDFWFLKLCHRDFSP